MHQYTVGSSFIREITEVDDELFPQLSRAWQIFLSEEKHPNMSFAGIGFAIRWRLHDFLLLS